MSRRRFLVTAGAAALVPTLTGGSPVGRLLRAASSPPPGSFASSTTRTVAANGAWSWFQSDRVVVDPVAGRAWFGVAAGGSGHGGLAPVSVVSTTLDRDLAVDRVETVGQVRTDDHASPGLVLDCPGQPPVLGWATHRGDKWVEFARAGEELTRVTATSFPAGAAYAAMHRVGDRLWCLTRADGFQWCLMIADRPEGPWHHKGRVVQALPSPRTGHQYGAAQRPYLRSASDGSRLWVVASDGHPEEGHGVGAGAFYVRPDYGICDSRGRLIGQVGNFPVNHRQMTRIQNGTPGRIVPGEHGLWNPYDTAMWPCDLSLRGTAASALLSERSWRTARDGRGRFKQRLALSVRRPDGSWSYEPVAWLGSELYEDQISYSGLGALHPTIPGRVVIASNVNPSTNAPLISTADGLQHWEIFEGQRRTTAGPWERRWTWTQLTRNSSEDNLRPVIAAAGGRAVLAWMRGHYWNYEHYSTSIVARYSG